MLEDVLLVLSSQEKPCRLSTFFCHAAAGGIPGRTRRCSRGRRARDLRRFIPLNTVFFIYLYKKVIFLVVGPLRP